MAECLLKIGCYVEFSITYRSDVKLFFFYCSKDIERKQVKFVNFAGIVWALVLDQ